MRLYVPVTVSEYDRLRALARAERRRPQEQAAYMLGRLLREEPDIVDPRGQDEARPLPRAS